MPFSVHVDPSELARQELAATAPGHDHPSPAGRTEEHHGANDVRLAARQSSERARGSRAPSAGRTYAFRRS